jgi:predicted dithiol-disulfide oxidoreductase (DUF899 family)
MTYAETMAALEAQRVTISALRKEMRAIQATIEPQVVDDYEFDGWDGPVQLSALFGDKANLILIHNMGVGCTSCTMWADGFNGVYDHLASRAAFVVASPNPVAVQRKFAAGRGWRFPMVSYGRSRFAADMGHRHENSAVLAPWDGWDAGVSTFRREGQRILRLSNMSLGPFDNLCVVYHLFDLVPGADINWEPRYSYAS